MKIRILNTALLAGVLGTNPLRGAEDSLPLLKDGKIPTTVDELWGNYDPSKEPLETEIVREWKEGDITIRHVVFTMGTFKGQNSRLAAFYAFPKSDKKLPSILQIHGGGGKAQLSAAILAADNDYAGLSINWNDQTPSLPDSDPHSNAPLKQQVPIRLIIILNDVAIAIINLPSAHQFRSMTPYEKHHVNLGRSTLRGAAASGRLTINLRHSG